MTLQSGYFACIPQGNLKCNRSRKTGAGKTKTLAKSSFCKGFELLISGGEGGIRTLGTLARTPDFESGTFDHSATSPDSVVHTILLQCEVKEYISIFCNFQQSATIPGSPLGRT
jgi:hypothetical protein